MVNTKTRECEKCKKRFKVLSYKGVCLYCDGEGYHKSYPANYKIKK